MGTESLAEADRVVQAIWFALWMGVAMSVFFFLTHRGADGAPTRWRRFCSWFADRYFTSSRQTETSPNNRPADGAETGALREKRNDETPGNGIAIGKSEGNDPFQFPSLFTGLARLVLAEKLGETDAIKLAVKASPGKSPRYVEARARLHAAIEHERPQQGGPRFVVYDDKGQPQVGPDGQIVTTTGRSCGAPRGDKG